MPPRLSAATSSGLWVSSRRRWPRSSGAASPSRSGCPISSRRTGTTSAICAPRRRAAGICSKGGNPRAGAMTDLRDLIRFYDGVLPPTLCKRIVAMFESAPEHHIGPRGRPLGQRDSERHFNWVQMNTSDRPGFAEIDEEIARAVNQHVERYVADTGYGLFPYGFEEFLIKRYLPSLQDQFPP